MRPAALLLALLLAAPGRSAVVINEVLYHAPGDLDRLEFVELHNTSGQAVDLAGWKLKGDVKYTFPAKTTLAAGGYLVLARDLKELKRHYALGGAGQYEGTLGRNRGRVELADAAGRRADRVRYGSRAPWPVAPDGYTSSLERVCPTAPGDTPANWAPSPLSATSTRPGGTPGKKNSTHAAHLPPVIANVTFTPANPSPKEQLKVEADVRSEHELTAVELRYRVAGPGSEGKEEAVKMTKGPAGRYSASVPAQKAGGIIRFRVRAADAKKGERHFPHPNDLRPALSAYAHDKFPAAKVPFGLVINVGRAPAGARPFNPWMRWGGGPAPSPLGRGKAAFVWVDAKTGTPRLFDHVNVTPRTGGRKVRFHKDRPLDGMTTINLIHEGSDRFLMAEALAYEVYRKAGNAAPRSEIVRTWIDGRPIGLQLLVEQPNKAFLRRHKVRAGGNLYKLIWQGRDLVGQHEKKTNARAGHDDLKKIVAELNKAKGDEQWKLIKKHFDVEQVINYFAANALLSHWDGFFNNYFAYHDAKGTGKWTMYPWDQDKTWGYHDGTRGHDVFFDMPITFGMAGDRPPGWPKDRPAPTYFFAGPIWWRPPGHFSGPLLANATFRKLYLARVKELLDKVYTEEVFGPIIKELGVRMAEEVKYRAGLRRENVKAALQELDKNVSVMREHLKKRRKFLLAEAEVKKAGQFDRALLK